MAVEKFYDAKIYYGPWDMTARHNQVSVDHNAEMLEVTTFGDTTRINMAGLKTWQISASGFWEAATTPTNLPDPNFFTQMGAAGQPLTIFPKNVDLGTAFFLETTESDFSFFGQLGEVIPFSITHNPTRYGTRGQVALQAVQKVGAGNGSNVPLGTLTAAQKLVASLHVIEFSGTNMTMLIESDDAGGFASATTRITFTAATGITSEWKELLGPITPDNLFRARWTGTFTSFTAVVAVGIVNT